MKHKILFNKIKKELHGKLPPKPTQSVSSVCLGLFAETQKKSRHTNVSTDIADVRIPKLESIFFEGFPLFE